MKFLYLSVFIVIVVFIIFAFFNKKDKNLQNRIKNSIIDSITFGSGLVLFLYLFGKIFSINYLSQIDESALLLAIFLASIFLMSFAADKYYKEISKFIKKLWGKNGKKYK